MPGRDAGPGFHCGDSLPELGQCGHVLSGETRKQESVSSLSLLFQLNYGPISGLAPLGPTEDKAEDRKDVLGGGRMEEAVGGRHGAPLLRGRLPFLGTSPPGLGLQVVSWADGWRGRAGAPWP